MTDEINRAPAKPCHECPWRRSNKDRPVPEKYGWAYSRAERVEMWSQMRAEAVLASCHLTTDRSLFPEGGDPVWIEAGFHPVPEDAQVRECAGAVALALRELRLLVAAGTWERYERGRPHGFTRGVASLWANRLRGSVAGYPTLRRVETADADIVDPGEDGLTALDLLTPTQVSELRAAIEAVARSPRTCAPR